jgi:hypothetical protein
VVHAGVSVSGGSLDELKTAIRQLIAMILVHVCGAANSIRNDPAW